MKTHERNTVEGWVGTVTSGQSVEESPVSFGTASDALSWARLYRKVYGQPSDVVSAYRDTAYNPNYFTQGDD